MAKNYVCDGSKIECRLCTKSEGTLKVTSNEIHLQDKYFVTEGDKSKENLIFEGNCKKSSFQASPCASVIVPDNWKGTGGLLVQEQRALLEDSTIMCNYGGVEIKIIDHLQKNEPSLLMPLTAPALCPIDDPLISILEWKSNKELDSIEIADKVIEKTIVGDKVWLEACTLNILPGEEINFEITEEQEDGSTDLLETSATVEHDGKVMVQLKNSGTDFKPSKLKAVYGNKYDSYFKAFYFAENGKPSSGNGNLSGYSQANADYVVVFKSANDQTAAHEFLHSLNLTHSFANNEVSANAEFTYEYRKTDNLLDYSRHTDNNNKRCALWYWQWIRANNSIT